jgi:hypothetical protein
MKHPPTPADPEESELLAMLVAGEISPEDSRVKSFFDRNPRAAGRWVELNRAADELNHASEVEHAAITEAQLATTDGDRALVARSLRSHLPPARHPRSIWRIAAAAVLLLGMGALLVFNWKPTEPNTPVMMSGGSARLIAPIGDVTSFDEFRWDGPRGLNVWYEVTVWSSAGEGEVGRSGRLDATEWKPKPDVHAHWPDRIRWEVVRGSANSPGASLGVAEARRSH